MTTTKKNFPILSSKFHHTLGACGTLLVATWSAQALAQPGPAAAPGQSPVTPTVPAAADARPPDPESVTPAQVEAPPSAEAVSPSEVPAPAAPAPEAPAAEEAVAEETVAAAPVAPPPDSVTPLAVSGSFFSRHELRDGYAEQGLKNARLHREGDVIVYRARLGLQTTPVSIGETSTVSATFVPQASGTHSTQGGLATVGDAYDLGVYESYVRLQGATTSFDFGRFAMNYGDALVIGNLDWHEAARAFQGGRVHYAAPSKLWVDAFATLITEGQPTTGEVLDGDVYFYGVYAGLGPMIGEMDLDFYLLGQSSMSREVNTADPMDATAMPELTTQDGATLVTVGGRVKQALGSFDYRAEAGLQFGSTQVAPGADPLSKFAYQADAEVGISPAPGLRLALGGLVASGDSDPTDDKDGAWDQLYPTAHKFLGLADVFGGRSNALSGSASVKYKVAESLILQIDGHLLSRAEENADGNSYVGTEIDTNVVSPLGKGAVVRAMYGAFLPDKDYWPEDNAIHYLEVQFGYDFK